LNLSTFCRYQIPTHTKNHSQKHGAARACKQSVRLLPARKARAGFCDAHRKNLPAQFVRIACSPMILMTHL
jgi:hypothetical protein